MAQAKHSKPNNYAELPVVDLGHGHSAILDPADYHRLKRHRWFAKKSRHAVYAVRRQRRGGRETLIRMHREITAAPPDKDVHHINHNTLDNRRHNLHVCTPAEHRRLEKDPL